MIDYQETVRQARIKVLELLFKAQTSHAGSNMSCIDILSILFEKADFKKDKLVVSKGWVAASVYVLVAMKGLIPKKDLETYCKPDSKYIGLIEPLGFFGAETAGGSMGLSFSMGIGMARAKKLLKKEGTIYILMSDGEMHCGNIWESCRKAIQEKLDNVVVIVDKNGFCAMGETDKILKIEPEEMFSKWDIRYIDGHNFEDLGNMMDYKSEEKKPVVFIAKTIKGYPISFMSANNDWHYRHLDIENYQKAINELNEIKTDTYGGKIRQKLA